MMGKTAEGHHRRPKVPTELFSEGFPVQHAVKRNPWQ